MIKDQTILSLVIMLIPLITFNLDRKVIILGENIMLKLKGLSMLSDVPKNVWHFQVQSQSHVSWKKITVTVFLLSYCYVLVSKGKRLSHLTLNDWSLSTQLILFSEKFDWDKINTFLTDQSLTDLLYGWKFWSWIFIKPCCNGGVGQHSRVTVHFYSLTS